MESALYSIPKGCDPSLKTGEFVAARIIRRLHREAADNPSDEALKRSLRSCSAIRTCRAGDLPILGFRFGSAAYLTDHGVVPAETLEKLRGLDILFLDALRYYAASYESFVETSCHLDSHLYCGLAASGHSYQKTTASIFDQLINSRGRI